MNSRWMTIFLLVSCLGCSSSKAHQHQMSMDMGMMMPSDNKPLQMQLAAKRYLQEHVKDSRGKTILFIVDRTMNAEALDAYMAASESLGIYSTSVVVEAKRDVDTPARLLVAYQDNWLPRWILDATSSVDQVFLGTYWNYQAFLPASATGKWQQLPYITSDQLLSPEARFSEPLRQAVESSLASTLQQSSSAGIEISDPEGTKLKLGNFSVAGTDIEKPVTADGQIAFSVYDGLNSPMQITIQNGRVAQIAGGGQLGDYLRSVAAKQPLELLDIRFGLNPKAALPKKFENLTWTAWVSEWSSMNRRSGTVRYEVGSTSKKGLSWEFANFYPTVVANNQPLIQAGHLLALDSPAVTGVLTAQDKKAQMLKEVWSPYPVKPGKEGKEEKEEDKNAVAKLAGAAQ